MYTFGFTLLDMISSWAYSLSWKLIIVKCLKHQHAELQFFAMCTIWNLYFSEKLMYTPFRIFHCKISSESPYRQFKFVSEIHLNIIYILFNSLREVYDNFMGTTKIGVSQIEGIMVVREWKQRKL